MMAATLVGLYAVLALLAGAPAPPRGPMEPQVNWISGAGFAWPVYRNFYMAFRQYPGYGIAHYDIDQRWYKEKYEDSYLADAALQCREAFSTAYHADRIGRWEDPPGFVPFRLKHVVLVIVNRGETDRYDTGRQAYKVAIILDATELFDAGADVPALVRRAVHDHEVVLWPRGADGGTPPVGQPRYLVIERHMESRPPGSQSPG
jgi:hypothetical protein